MLFAGITPVVASASGDPARRQFSQTIGTEVCEWNFELVLIVDENLVKGEFRAVLKYDFAVVEEAANLGNAESSLDVGTFSHDGRPRETELQNTQGRLLSRERIGFLNSVVGSSS